MKIHRNQFIGIEPTEQLYEDSKVVLQPVPYEGGISYGCGTAQAPETIIEASKYLEFYDDQLEVEPHTLGFCTMEPLNVVVDPEKMIHSVYATIKSHLSHDKFPIVVGGDHSISTGFCQALHEQFGTISVIQLDAHADLRYSYEDSLYSHACVMSRIREITNHTLQIGMRSISKEEALNIKEQTISLFTMEAFRNGVYEIDSAIKKLPDPVFLTLDVDVFDWSVISSTGTPEPGGLLWDEALKLLKYIFLTKHVVGFDVVELSANENDRNSPFAAAKIIYKMIGMKFFQLR